MKNFIDRLKEYMEFKGINNNQLTVSAGLSTGLIGKALKTGSGLHSDSIEKILYAYPDLNPSWLLKGIGEMIIKSENKYLNENKTDMITESTSGYYSICIEKDKQIEHLTAFIDTLTKQLEEANKNTELYRMLLNEIKKEASKDDSLNKQSA